MNDYIRYVVISLAIITTCTVNAAPAITNVDLSNLNNNVITINGSGFSDGPTVQLYDNFEGGTKGELIPMTSAKIGLWKTYKSATQPSYDDISHSGQYSARIFNLGMKQFNQTLPEGTTEVFYSYWVHIPPGTPFPGKNGGIRKFSSDSSWKLSWIFDQNYNGTDSDICIPTWTGGTFYLAGNDFNLATDLDFRSRWDWDNWMRISIWLKANESDPTSPGIVQFQSISAGKGLYSKTWTNKAVFDKDGPAKKQFQNLNFPGWVRSSSSVNTRILYDDIYLAVGKNAVARVELGDQPTYAASKTLEIQTSTSWNNNNIVLTLRQGTIEDPEKAYFYVTDASGQVNSNGFSVGTFPNPPINLIAE